MLNAQCSTNRRLLVVIERDGEECDRLGVFRRKWLGGIGAEDRVVRGAVEGVDVRWPSDDELGDLFEDLGLVGVRSKNLGFIQWVRGRKP